jgi:hypothetical protein
MLAEVKSPEFSRLGVGPDSQHLLEQLGVLRAREAVDRPDHLGRPVPPPALDVPHEGVFAKR